MKTTLKQGFELWWKLAQKWFAGQFDALRTTVANIDLSRIIDSIKSLRTDLAAVKMNVASVKTDVADVTSSVEDVKSAVENIDFSELAKQETAEQIQLLASMATEPAVVYDETTRRLTFRLFTIKQFEDITIETEQGDAQFMLTIEPDTATNPKVYLDFTDNSPGELSGRGVATVDKVVYNDNYILNVSITLPEDIELSAVFIDGSECDLLEDLQWRVADIQRKIANVSIDLSPVAKEATTAKEAHLNELRQFFGLPQALPEYTALTPAEAIAIARDCQYNVMGTDWPIPTWLPTGVTEAQVESAAEGLGIPYHEPTQTA